MIETGRVTEIRDGSIRIKIDGGSGVVCARGCAHCSGSLPDRFLDVDGNFNFSQGDPVRIDCRSGQYLLTLAMIFLLPLALLAGVYLLSAGIGFSEPLSMGLAILAACGSAAFTPRLTRLRRPALKVMAFDRSDD